MEMKRRTHTIWIVLVVLGAGVIALASGQKESLDEILAEFTSTDWSTVRKAKIELESQQKSAIARLVELTGQHERRKLENTADLIYPGATQFYGHGFIVDYDIDWISIRAGWALEELTFQQFGFREGAIDHDQLLAATMAGKADRPLGEVIDVTREEARTLERQRRAAEAVQEWWDANRQSWTRLKGLMQALDSPDTRRQMQALEWIRHGETDCDGLTKAQYLETIYPRIEQLAESTDESVADQASYLVRDYADDEWWWYEQKQQ